MFANYALTKEDYKAIEEGIEIAYGEKMKHVFPGGLGDIDLVTYDAKFIYLWSRRHYNNLEKTRESVCRFKIYWFPHKLTLVDDDYDRMALTVGGIRIGGERFKDLPSLVNIQYAPITARSKLRTKRYKIPAKEADYIKAQYRVIILHEFGHLYFHRNLSSVFQDDLLSLARSPSKEISKTKLTSLLNPPNPSFTNALFATLVELEVTKTFYPKFLKKTVEDMSRYVKSRLEADLEEEGEEKILLIEDSHLYAKILAPHVFKNLPDWPKRLVVG